MPFQSETLFHWKSSACENTCENTPPLPPPFSGRVMKQQWMHSFRHVVLDLYIVSVCERD